MGDPLPAILVLNAGSSSVKFSVFDVAGDGAPAPAFGGQIEGIGLAPKLALGDGGASAEDAESFAAAVGSDGDHAAAIDWLLGWLDGRLAARDGDGPARRLDAVGHRVVHGGPDFAAPMLVDAALLERLEALVPLAPLHQPHNLAGIEAVARRAPALPQVACFDTAFHRGHSELAERFAIPDWLYREGVRRYGFHGLSYDSIAGQLPQRAPEIARGRVIVAHLGNGASLCALDDGRSLDSTMSFTALDGLPMGTRCGAIDPGVGLYLMAEKGYDRAALEDFYYRQCGLKGLSGISSDLRDLEASERPGAKLAIDYFVQRICREIGALTAVLGGLDGLVFTAGIGENATEIRAAVCAGCAWLGVALDAAANRAGGPRITLPGAAVSAWVIATDEERTIALRSLETLGEARR